MQSYRFRCSFEFSMRFLVVATNIMASVSDYVLVQMVVPSTGESIKNGLFQFKGLSMSSVILRWSIFRNVRRCPESDGNYG